MGPSEQLWSREWSDYLTEGDPLSREGFTCIVEVRRSLRIDLYFLFLKRVPFFQELQHCFALESGIEPLTLSAQLSS